MVDYAIYGKIIVDAIRLLDGSIVRGVLGGGGPQGAFGARLWSPSVGLLTRSGTDLDPACRDMLHGLQINLEGWIEYPDIPTPRGGMEYDDKQYLTDRAKISVDLETLNRSMTRILANPISLPASYQNPRVIHLITEYAHEPMVQSALDLKANGAIFSLEPLVDFRKWENKQEITGLIRIAHTATPDWPSACGIAGSDDPLSVLKFWSRLGPELICLRNGSEGSYVWDCFHDRCWHIPPVPVQVIDPTGAGNSYGGGMCVGWAETKDALQAGCYGGVSASFLVERVGLPVLSAALENEARARLQRALETAIPM